MSNCDWANASELSKNYHDQEWGRPLHDEQKLFEHLALESLQCGLSWNLMLEKREIFRSCFDNFDYQKVAKYNEADINRILNTEGMIRSPRKVKAIINNAQNYMQIIESYGSFDTYLWDYSDGKTILYQRHAEGKVPVSNGLSKELSKDLKKRGFKYVGPVTIYSFLQACGIINDHQEDCPFRDEINKNNPTIEKLPDAEKL